jgi:ribonuclease Z
MFKPEVKSNIGEDISILIQLDNHASHYICECGDASNLSVKDCQNAEAIFVSHTHIDHFVNFDTILRHQIGIGKRVVICGPLHITEQVQAKIRGYSWNLITEDAILYEVREIVDAQTIRRSELRPPFWHIEALETLHSPIIYSNDRFTVQCTVLDHKIPSIAYLFKEKNSNIIDLSNSELKGGSWVKELKNAFEAQAEQTEIEVQGRKYIAKDLFHLIAIKKGDSVGVIMDHTANEANHAKIKALFLGCNKVFIECFYKASDKAFAEQNFHSYSEQSGKIMRECGVKQAVPVHFSRKYDSVQIAEIIAEFNASLLA